MSGFPGSPGVLQGAIVAVDQVPPRARAIPFQYNSRILPEMLSDGIRIDLDDAVLPGSVIPVGRLLIEVPYPVPDPIGPSPSSPALRQASATHPVEVNGSFEAGENMLFWRPDQESNGGLAGLLVGILRAMNEWWGQQVVREQSIPILMRFQLDGWAILNDEQRLRPNTHVNAYSRGGQTVYEFPTDDEVTGGRFETSFHLELG